MELVLDNRRKFADSWKAKRFEMIDKAVEVEKNRIEEERDTRIEEAKTKLLQRISHEFHSLCEQNSNVATYISMYPDKLEIYEQLNNITERTKQAQPIPQTKPTRFSTFKNDAHLILKRMKEHGISILDTIIMTDNYMYYNGAIITSGMRFYLKMTNEYKEIIVESISKNTIEVSDVQTGTKFMIQREELEGKIYQLEFSK